MMQQPGQQSMPPSQYQQQQQPSYMTQHPPQQMWGNNQPPTQQIPSQQQQSGLPGSTDEVRTLWIGDLPQWMDENYLLGCFSQTGEVVSVKIIRNKQTGQSEGYGFIEFTSHAAAERILQTVNGTMMPHGEQVFRLNWASSGGGEKRDDAPEYTIFVGDLAADVTEFMLQETFRPHYPSVKGAKVVIDRLTGRTKGYGFVSFGDENEQQRAISEMNGAFCSTRPMRLGLASNKKTVPGQQQATASYQNPQNQNDSDLSNTTIFVGNLDSNVTDDHLRELFGQYGQLLHVKIPVGKRCGFVRFADRSSAEEALRVLNGTQISGQSIRLSWGRSPSSKQAQPDANQWNSGYYGAYPQGYENYGYGNVPQNPNMYYGAYPGYGNYQQAPPQQQQPQPQQQMGYR